MVLNNLLQSRCWNRKFLSFILKYVFVVCSSDSCVFVRRKNAVMIHIWLFWQFTWKMAWFLEVHMLRLLVLMVMVNYLKTEFKIKVIEKEMVLSLEWNVKKMAVFQFIRNRILRRFWTDLVCKIAKIFLNRENFVIHRKK